MNYLRVCFGLALVGVWSLLSPITLAEDKMDDHALTMLSAIEANTERYGGSVGASGTGQRWATRNLRVARCFSKPSEKGFGIKRSSGNTNGVCCKFWFGAAGHRYFGEFDALRDYSERVAP